jgi:broad specificity phosphatase PhoE
MLRAVERIVERHPAGRVVVVTHGGSLRRLQAAVACIASPVIENCAVWAVAHEDGRFRPID